MTSLRRMIGMPVVYEGKALGYVERGLLTQGARKLQGLVIRRGLGSARWVPRKLILVIGNACVVVCGEGQRMPGTPELQLNRVYLTTGECAGQVTDAVIDGATLRVLALEVSSGPLYHLMGQRQYALEYSVRQEEPYLKTEGMPCEVVASMLCTWEQVLRRDGQQGRRRNHEHSENSDCGGIGLCGGRGGDDHAREPKAQAAGHAACGSDQKDEQDVVGTGCSAQPERGNRYA